MKALTPQQFETLTASDGESFDVVDVWELVQCGFVRIAASPTHRRSGYFVNTDRGNLAVRVHRAFLGVPA